MLEIFLLLSSFRLACGDSSGDIGGHPQEVHHLAASESAQVFALGRLAAQRHQTFQYPAECRLPHQGVRLRPVQVGG